MIISIKLYLVLPATIAVSERSGSTLRRIKNWFRSTMTQKCLKHCILFFIYKDKTNLVSLVQTANEFSEVNDERFQIFGWCSNSDYVVSRNLLLEFSQLHNLHITNNIFEHKSGHKRTWTSPLPPTFPLKNPYRNQIGNMLLRKIWTLKYSTQDPSIAISQILMIHQL